MRIINSPLCSIDIDRLVSHRSRGKTKAAAKRFVHKQERARLCQLDRQNLIQDHLMSLAEQIEQDRLDLGAEFSKLMRKVMSKGHPGHRHTSNARPVERFELLVERGSNTGARSFACLASCANVE